MASTPLTLAALATSAVPGLRVTGARRHSAGGDDDYASAVLSTDRGEAIVRVPRTSAAEVRQSAEMLGLSALSEGSRAALPFAVPETWGITRAGETRAVVSSFLPGAHIAADALESEAILLQPIARSLAAIHRLPVTTVQQAGLAVRSAEAVREDAVRLVDRAAETRLLPDLVRAHWTQALEADRLWDFSPTVVHGAFDAEQLLVADDQVVGVLGWDAFSVGDPALDLAWLLTSGTEVFDALLARYIAERGTAGSAELRARTRFHHELEVARWLLHGVDAHDRTVVDDAVSMLDRLVDRLSRISRPVDAPRPAASAEEVERLLDEVPDVGVDPRSETAEYEALDEDRAFLSDDDFADDGTTPIGAEPGPAGADPGNADPGNADPVSADPDPSAQRDPRA